MPRGGCVRDLHKNKTLCDGVEGTSPPPVSPIPCPLAVKYLSLAKANEQPGIRTVKNKSCYSYIG